MLLSALLLLAAALSAGLEHDPVGGEIAVEAAPHRVVVTTAEETVIASRPWAPAPRVATVAAGTRLSVRGVIEGRDKKGCSKRRWLALWPFGYVCEGSVQPTDRAASARSALVRSPTRHTAFSAAVVRVDDPPIYATLADLAALRSAGALRRGDHVDFDGSVELHQRTWLRLESGAYVERSALQTAEGSMFSGVAIVGATEPGPGFAWTAHKTVVVRARPDEHAEKVDALPLRSRVPLLESGVDATGRVWWRIGADRWVLGELLNEVHYTAVPRGVARDLGDDGRWIDVDVGEQVLVAYRGARPEFATLISSGRGSGTPLGDYPIWAKVASVDMSNQGFEDTEYLVEGVPWVMFFQGHNALHGAYWHDKFGHKKSHGCVNLSPLDARHLFEWAGATLLEGWTGYLPPSHDRAAIVHIRDSSRAEGRTFTQERPIGPPDFAAEARLTAEAEARRAAERVELPPDDGGAGSLLYDPSGGGAGEASGVPLPRPAMDAGTPAPVGD